MARRGGSAWVRWLALAVLLAAAVAGGVGLYLRYGWPSVNVTQVVQGPVAQAFYATGTLLPVREYAVRSNVEGVLLEVRVDKGDAVRQGQKLAFVRVEDYQMRHSQAKANHDLAALLADDRNSPALREFDARHRAAQEQWDIARRDLERVADLRRRNAASESDYDRSAERVLIYQGQAESIRAARAARLEELKRDVQVARAALEIAQWNLDQQTIVSPVDGVVLDQPVSAGTRVRVNDHLLQIADVRPAELVVRAQVDEEDRVRLGRVRQVLLALYSYPGRQFVGRVKEVYPKANLDRRTFEVDIAVDRPDEGFAAGMTGELAFVVAQREQCTVVPRQAVQLTAAGPEQAATTAPADAAQPAVAWVVRQGALEERPVRVGLLSIERAEIVSGLAPGETVVISPFDGLSPGQRVRSSFVDPARAAGLNKPRQEKAFRGFN